MNERTVYISTKDDKQPARNVNINRVFDKNHKTRDMLLNLLRAHAKS